MKFSEIVRLGVQGRFCGRMLPPTIAFLPRSCRIPIAFPSQTVAFPSQTVAFPSQTAANLLRSTPYAVYTVCLKQVRR